MRRQWMWQTRWLALALLTACGTAAPSGDGTTADAGDATATDVAKDAKDTGSGKPDATDAADSASADADDVTATQDGGGDTAADASDADVLPGNCANEPGAPGCPCQENGDCDLPLCLPTAQGSLCAKACIDTCPDGFKCVGVSGSGGDIQTVCVDKWPHLCDPCVNSNQCGAVGLQGAVCVDGGKDGRFCGTACKLDTDCPNGYACGAGKSVEGTTVTQCVPKGGAACTCSASAIANQLSTPCFAQATDEGGQVVGECKGIRACGSEGLTACNASIQTETCNGLDDNCNGKVDEGTCDDKNPCTMDTCDASAQACGHSNAPGSCDADGNNCTVGDSCIDGKCAIGTLKSCDDNNPCTTDACDPLTGCTKAYDDGLPCSDGSGCTVGDTCMSGACVPGTVKTCPANEACLSWTCDATTGQCKQSAKPDGTSCSDGTVCTSGDICTSGACAGSPVSCDDNNPCTLDTCDPVANCKHDAANTPCNDNNACTTDDTCVAKKCNGTAINVATECGDGNPCTTDTCDKIAGCIYTANTNGCNDGNGCTVGDVCENKVCKSGTNTCSCQIDSDCASKEDGNLCNGTLYCDTTTANHQCKVNPATLINCSTAGDTPCSQTACDPGSGACVATSLPDGKSCDADGSVCTPNDTCNAGACIAGAQKSCDDNNVCTDDSCDALFGCQNTANVNPCDGDGDACTVNDTCVGTYCKIGPKKNCDDGLDCTQDACDQSSGACFNDPTPQNNKSCDADGSICTAGDKCVGGTCTAGATVACADTNPCTTDFCDPVNGCGHNNLPDGTACGVAGNWCQALQCVKKPVCGDKVVDAGEACDDGNLIDGDGCSSNCQFDKAVVPAPGELIFSELMPAPGGNPQDEWMEIYNNSPKPLLLEGLYFGDNQFYLQLTNGSGNWVLLPGEYATISALTVIGGYKGGGIIPDFYYGYTPNAGPQFNNSSDSACISTDAQCTKGIIAKASWGNGDTVNGLSLTLRKSKYSSEFKAGTATYDKTNWCFGSALIPGGDKDYGTPGAADPNCP